MSDTPQGWFTQWDLLGIRFAEPRSRLAPPYAEGAPAVAGQTIYQRAATLAAGPLPADPDPYINHALRFILALQEAAANLSPPEIQISQVELPPQPTYANTVRPDLNRIQFTLPPIPAEFAGRLDIAGLMPEPFDDAPPEMAFGSRPEAEFGPLPTAPGVRTDFEIPDLDLSLPVPPEMLSIRIQPFDGIVIPEVPTGIPEMDLVPPSIREYVPGAQYSSSLLTGVREELERRIRSGGTGLNPLVENAIWDRGRDREARTMRDQLDGLERFEALGYALPPGVYLDARLKIATENAAANMGVSREIMIKQAELELESVRQALTLAESVEAKALDIANQIEQRAFEATRYATEAGVQIYNARVQGFGMLVEVYKTKVQAYEVRLRAELAKLDAYRAELEAERLKVDMNSARVAQYQTMVQAALSAVEVYRAQIQGIQAKAEMEKLKVQIFGEQVRAYGTQVNAFTAQVEAFRVGIQAETAKLEAYRTAVQSYGIQVDAGGKVIGARIAEFQALAGAKETEWRAYTSRASAESERVRAIAAQNTSIAQMYGADVGAVSSYNEVLGRQWTATTQASVNVANISLEQAKANAQLYMLQQSMILDAAKVGATVSSQMGAAALSANSYSTSFSNSRAVSAGTSYSYTNNKGYQNSHSGSTSTVRTQSV